MKLAGRDFDPEALLETLEGRLRRRGLSDLEARPITLEGVEPRVDPAAFYLDALESHADPTAPLPLVTHRGGLVGHGVLVAKRLFRAVGRPVVNELLARQRLFNGYVRSAFGEVFETLETLEARLDALTPPSPVQRAAPGSGSKKSTGRTKKSSAPTKTASRAKKSMKPRGR